MRRIARSHFIKKLKNKVLVCNQKKMGGNIPGCGVVPPGCWSPSDSNFLKLVAVFFEVSLILF